jgi:glycosyltransferase involved in cell wall biosynthesis
MGNDEYQKIRQNAYSFVKENYDYEDIVKKYIAIFEKEYSRYHAKGGNGQ